MNTEMTLLRLAGSNDGIVTRREAMAAGCSSSAIDRRLASGFLIQVLPRVYRVAAHPGDYLSEVRAAFRWAGEGTVVAGGTVLALFGLSGFDGAQIDLYVPTHKSAPGINTRELPEERLPIRPAKGMVLTSIERALLDACRNHPAGKVGKAMDDALRRKLTNVARLREAIPSETRGVRGAKAFSRLVRGRDLDDQTVRSEMEARMLKILRRLKGHRAVPNFEVRGRQGRYFIDFAFPHAMLAVECHSRMWHGTEQAASDTDRHNDLTELGWTILYFTWDEIVFRPDEVLRKIEGFLRPSFAL